MKLEHHMTSTRILVTGGAGFIGSEVTRQLCDAGAFVIVVDNLVNGKRENLNGISDDRYQLSTIDIRDTDALDGLLQDIDIVYHLACLGVRHSIHSPYENHLVNADATLQLLKLCKQKNVRRFVYISTSEVYGTARWVPMTEEHPTYPMTVYGAAKLAGESYTRAFNATYDYPTVVVRPFNTYGPNCHHEGDSGEVIPRFMLRCMAGQPMVIFGDGTQTRDFTYVTDTARGIILAGLAERAVGETINLGHGQELTINDLARMIAQTTVTSQESAILYDDPRPGDVLRLYADMAKARDLLGYDPATSLSEGLATLMQWYIKSGKTPQALLEDESLRNWEMPEGGDLG
jgi:UDP-glucose 4-epimerase